MEWKEVESSNIAAIAYDKEQQELHVRFNSGAEYAYYEVPVAVYQEFLIAPSKGKYLNEGIKGFYQFEKV